MAKMKKTFDKESMYKKIMPTNLKKEEEIPTGSRSNESIEEFSGNNIFSETAIFQNKELNIIKEEKKFQMN